MVRIVSEDDAFVRIAPMPRANVSPATDPLKPPVAVKVEDPEWRPRTLTDVYTDEGICLIHDWYRGMAKYEAAQSTLSRLIVLLAQRGEHRIATIG